MHDGKPIAVDLRFDFRFDTIRVRGRSKQDTADAVSDWTKWALALVVALAVYLSL